jgi:hypothetical protein
VEKAEYPKFIEMKIFNINYPFLVLCCLSLLPFFLGHFCFHFSEDAGWWLTELVSDGPNGWEGGNMPIINFRKKEEGRRNIE